MCLKEICWSFYPCFVMLMIWAPLILILLPSWSDGWGTFSGSLRRRLLGSKSGPAPFSSKYCRICWTPRWQNSSCYILTFFPTINYSTHSLNLLELYAAYRLLLDCLQQQSAMLYRIPNQRYAEHTWDGNVGCSVWSTYRQQVSQVIHRQKPWET